MIDRPHESPTVSWKKSSTAFAIAISGERRSAMMSAIGIIT